MIMLINAFSKNVCLTTPFYLKSSGFSTRDGAECLGTESVASNPSETVQTDPHEVLGDKPTEETVNAVVEDLPISSDSNVASKLKVKKIVFASQDIRYKNAAIPAQTIPKPGAAFALDPKSGAAACPKAAKFTVTKPEALSQCAPAAVGAALPRSAGPAVTTAPDQDRSGEVCLSRATGLCVLSLTATTPGQQFGPGERRRLAALLPDLVLLNTAGRGGVLLLGVDTEPYKLPELLATLRRECRDWLVTTEDTSSSVDHFSFFRGCSNIPRVDKSGMYQIIVNLKTVDGKGREPERRAVLMATIKNFNILQAVHGAGETILLVGHALELLAYCHAIQKQFTVAQRHSWKPRMLALPDPLSTRPAPRSFWVRPKSMEDSGQSVAHKQYSVFHELSKAGKVSQLEHALFGAADNYLVVFDKQKV